MLRLANLGAGELRKLVKTAEMMRDPDLEDLLDHGPSGAAS